MMYRIGRITLVWIASVVLLAGCAHFGAGPEKEQSISGTDDVQHPDQPPKLISCPQNNLPGNWRSTVGETTVLVELKFTVLPDGSVDGTTISHVRQSRFGVVRGSSLQEAESMAQGCRFHPALKEGNPVAASYSKRFRVLAEGL